MPRDKHFRIPSRPGSATRKRQLSDDRESRREVREESPGRRNEAGRTKSEEKDWRDAQAVREAMLIWYSCAKTVVSTSMVHGNVQELQEGEKIITACMHYYMSLQQWATTLEFVPQHILRHESVESTIDLLRQVRARFSNTYLNFLAVIQRKASGGDPIKKVYGIDRPIRFPEGPEEFIMEARESVESGALEKVLASVSPLLWAKKVGRNILTEESRCVHLLTRLGIDEKMIRNLGITEIMKSEWVVNLASPGRDPVAATRSVRGVSGPDAGASAASQPAPSHSAWAADRPPAREQECMELGGYREVPQERVPEEADAGVNDTVSTRNVQHLEKEIIKCTTIVTGYATENKKKIRKLEETTDAQYNDLSARQTITALSVDQLQEHYKSVKGSVTANTQRMGRWHSGGDAKFNEMQEKLKKKDQEMLNIKNEMTSLHNDVVTLNTEMATIKKEMKTVQDRLRSYTRKASASLNAEAAKQPVTLDAERKKKADKIVEAIHPFMEAIEKGMKKRPTGRSSQHPSLRQPSTSAVSVSNEPTIDQVRKDEAQKARSNSESTDSESDQDQSLTQTVNKVKSNQEIDPRNMLDAEEAEVAMVAVLPIPGAQPCPQEEQLEPEVDLGVPQQPTEAEPEATEAEFSGKMDQALQSFRDQ